MLFGKIFYMIHRTISVSFLRDTIQGAKNIDILNITLFHKLISNAPNGQNVFRCIGIFFNLFTNLSYECHDVAFVKKITVLPYCIINLFFGKTSPQLEARKNRMSNSFGVSGTSAPFFITFLSLRYISRFLHGLHHRKQKARTFHNPEQENLSGRHKLCM